MEILRSFNGGRKPRASPPSSIVESPPIHFKHLTFTEKDMETEESLKDLFDRWISHYHMAERIDDKAKRFEVFKDKIKFIHDFNKQGHSYKVGLNKFTAMTNGEFKSMYSNPMEGLIQGKGVLTHVERSSSGFMEEKEIELRQKRAVTRVKNEDPCGSLLAGRAGYHKLCRKGSSVVIVVVRLCYNAHKYLKSG